MNLYKLPDYVYIVNSTHVMPNGIKKTNRYLNGNFLKYLNRKGFTEWYGHVEIDTDEELARLDELLAIWRLNQT